MESSRPFNYLNSLAIQKATIFNVFVELVGCANFTTYNILIMWIFICRAFVYALCISYVAEDNEEKETDKTNCCYH